MNLECKDCNKALEDCICIENTVNMNKETLEEAAIKIVYYTETIDNWGKTESSSKGEVIYNILKNSNDFTDDMQFEDDKGRVYDIDSLIGKKVIVDGFDEFIVTE